MCSCWGWSRCNLLRGEYWKRTFVFQGLLNAVTFPSMNPMTTRWLSWTILDLLVLNNITLSGGPQKRRGIGKDLIVVLMEWIWWSWTWHSSTQMLKGSIGRQLFSRFVSYAYMGGSVGTVLTYPFCGWLLSWAKWEVWTCLMDHIFSPLYLFMLSPCYFTIFTLLAPLPVGVLHDRRGHPALVNPLVFPCTRSARGPSKVFNVFLEIRFGSICISLSSYVGSLLRRGTW